MKKQGCLVSNFVKSTAETSSPGFGAVRDSNFIGLHSPFWFSDGQITGVRLPVAEPAAQAAVLVLHGGSGKRSSVGLVDCVSHLEVSMLKYGQPKLKHPSLTVDNVQDTPILGNAVNPTLLRHVPSQPTHGK